MRFFRDFIISITALASGIWVLFYAETLIGKALSPELYGDYRVVITVVVFLGQILLFGLDYIIVKHLPQLLQNKSIENAKFFLSSIIKYIIYILIVWEAFAILINESANNLIFGRMVPEDIHPAYFYLACAGIFAVFTLVLKTIRALNYKILSAIIYNSWSWFLLGFMLTIPITLNSAVLSTIASYLIIISVCIVAIFLFFYKVRATEFPLPQNILRDAFNFTAQQVFAFQATGILLIIMEASTISEAKIGIFSATMMIANLSFIAGTSIKNVFMVPVISAIGGERLLLQKLLIKIYIVSAALSIFVSVVLYFLTPTLLRLYGLHFNSVFTFIPFALIGNIPGAIICGDTIFVNYFSSNTNRIFTYLTIFKAIMTITIGATLIKFFDIYGAMTAYIVVESIFALAVMRLKYVSIRSES